MSGVDNIPPRTHMLGGTAGVPTSAAPSPEEIGALPLGQVRITHSFPDRKDQTLCVVVDGEPVARLPVTKVKFEQDYSAGLGHVTLRLIAGDCLITSRPPMPPRSSASDPKLGAAPPSKPPLDPDHVSVR